MICFFWYYFGLFFQDKAFWQSQTDLIVQKLVEKTGGETSAAPVQQAQSSPTKPCRYGSACTRPNCRFRHPGQTQGQQVLSGGIFHFIILLETRPLLAKFNNLIFHFPPRKRNCANEIKCQLSTLCNLFLATFEYLHGEAF